MIDNIRKRKCKSRGRPTYSSVHATCGRRRQITASVLDTREHVSVYDWHCHLSPRCSDATAVLRWAIRPSVCLSVRPSVRPSVKRVNCYKTKET